MSIEEAPPVITPPQKHRLLISLIQTSDRESDIARLQRMFSIIRSFPGRDEVTLHLKNGENIDSLKLPNTGYCPELHQQLAELVGEEGLRVEDVSS